MDRFSKACLVMIVLLLGVIAPRPILLPDAAYAQAAKAKHYEYTWASLGPGDVGDHSFINLEDKLQPLLTKMAGDGWEPIGVASGGGKGGYLFIFRR